MPLKVMSFTFIFIYLDILTIVIWSSGLASWVKTVEGELQQQVSRVTSTAGEGVDTQQAVATTLVLPALAPWMKGALPQCKVCFHKFLPTVVLSAESHPSFLYLILGVL